MTTASPLRTQIQGIARAVYDRAVVVGAEPLVFPALLERVGALLRGVKDPARVELVCLRIVDEAGMRFSIWPWLSWGVFTRTTGMFDVPRDGWRYALVASRLPNGQLRDSIEHWLGAWQDCSAAGDQAGIGVARQRLDMLVPADGVSCP